MSGHGMKLEAAKFLMRIERSQRDLHAEKLRKLRNEKRAAEASLDALRAQVRELKAKWDQDDQDIEFAEALAALLDPPSGAQQKKDEEDLARAGDPDVIPATFPTAPTERS